MDCDLMISHESTNQFSLNISLHFFPPSYFLLLRTLSLKLTACDEENV